VPAGLEPQEVDAANWLIALGEVLERTGRVGQLRRLACEVLPNGSVIAKELHGSDRYVVHERLAEESDEDIRTLDPDTDMEQIDSFASWLTDIDEAASPVFASQAALAAAQVAVPCDSASVLQLDTRGLRFAAAAGPIATQLVGRYIPADAGAAGFAVQHRQVMVLYEVADDPRHYQELDKETGYKTRNLCCVPIVYDDVMIGVIEVVNFPTGEPFDATSITKLERVAHHLGRRIVNRGPVATLASATPADEDSFEGYGDPVTLDDIAMEPISVGDVALALPDDEDYGDYESDLDTDVRGKLR
jgi:putative methionine-R-sulfoxide reductase with GAF domain